MKNTRCSAFDEYCKSKWGWAKSYAYNLINAAEAVKELPEKTSTIVDNEGQARELSQAPKEKRARVIEIASTKAAAEDHGQWLPWVKENLPFTDDTARNYMRVFQRRDQIPKCSEFGVSDAYKLLSEGDKEKNVHAAKVQSELTTSCKLNKPRTPNPTRCPISKVNTP